MKKNMKFTEKYDVSTATIYKGNPNSLKIPPKGHPLYDPTAPTTFDVRRVEIIDREGQMTTPIEVWTDPDTGTLWVLDGRGRFLDVQEVNRRRTERKCDLVEPYIVPFNVAGADEKRAIARVREKNYHRRKPTLSGMALDVLALRNAGHSFEDCAKALGESLDAPEQWARKLLPIAFCISDVREAIDSGEFSRSIARKFGGGKLDGSKALGQKEQIALLADMRATQSEGKGATARSKPNGKAQARVEAALKNGETEDLRKVPEKLVADAAAAALAWIGGDKHAFSRWPKVQTIIDVAAEKPVKVKEPKKKKAKVKE